MTKIKWTKSNIGQIGIVETDNIPYKEAIKKIPKEARIMKAWELLKLYDEGSKSLRNIPNEGYYFTYGTRSY